jgi:hypothetical protein
MTKYHSAIAVAIVSLISFGTGSCSKEYDCDEPQLHAAFIGFTIAEIDTIILKKFKSDDHFQTLIETDTVLFANKYNSTYTFFGDTTSVFVMDPLKCIKAGFDWQILIPAINKTISVSGILDEKKTGKRGWGIFSMDPGPNCLNRVYSAMVDNQPFNFSYSDTAEYFRNYNIYIRH